MNYCFFHCISMRLKTKYQILMTKFEGQVRLSLLFLELQQQKKSKQQNSVFDIWFLVSRWCNECNLNLGSQDQAIILEWTNLKFHEVFSQNLFGLLILLKQVFSTNASINLRPYFGAVHKRRRQLEGDGSKMPTLSIDGPFLC